MPAERPNPPSWDHPEYERFPLRTQAAYDRYQQLSETMEPKQAMAQASREESENGPGEQP